MENKFLYLGKVYKANAFIFKQGGWFEQLMNNNLLRTTHGEKVLYLE